MTDQTERDGLDHTRDGVPEGRLLHASPVLPAKGEYEELMNWLERRGTQGHSLAAAAIRALEAKVRELQQVAFSLGNTGAGQAHHAELRAERDRLAGKVERLNGMYNQRMVHLHSAQDREVALLDEVARLTSELAAAREELAQRREHMRRGIEAGRSTGGEG